ncbi:MAG TPA: P-loop NTPase fold protein [Puia sp.]|uniref:P-loop NTPase fold protein n=1 Tax=Puia sp. TaxID=2045100 RepID=UPI002BEEB6BE|nr:P-loop NTPase fold protein [Puia sp.]HVU97639.1 P-loop NTPase fold protein [Puia sp.]
MASSEPDGYIIDPTGSIEKSGAGIVLTYRRDSKQYIVENATIRRFGYLTMGVDDIDMPNGFGLLHKPPRKPVLFIDIYNEKRAGNETAMVSRFVDAFMDNLQVFSGKTIWVGLLNDVQGQEVLDWLHTIVIDAIERLSEPVIKLGISFLVALPDVPVEPLRQGDLDRVAGILSDSEKGNDRLGIMQDVSAFARVMAAKSFEPPLAIALFGQWGSGKSFFMRMLQQSIGALSTDNPDGKYCEGVVHIRFNAWSYLDANLWASIMTRIFEGLNEYIHDNIPEEALGRIGEELTKQLNISKKEVAGLEEQKDSIQGQIDILEKQKKSLDADIKKNIGAIKARTAWQVVQEVEVQFDVQRHIEKVLEENVSYVRTKEELKAIVPEKYWEDPDAAYQEAKSKAAFVREFFRRDTLKGNLFWLVLILALIFLVPVFLQTFVPRLRAINFTLSQTGLSLLIAAGSIRRRAETAYNTLRPIAASFWKIKEDHEKQVKAALARFEQDEKALRLEIEKSKAELVVVEQQIHQNKAIRIQLQFKISNALNTEALYSFIEKRSKSEDYSKHLGLISIIRKDFEMLSYLFAGHKAEIANIKKAEELKAQFKANFRKPLERIVLYIDDLDRCPNENVVQVLEAVNLLMAYPLFVVVVGVDLSWIRNALLKRHTTQFAGIDAIDPARYLEKIIQVPFYLQEADDDRVKGMLSWLALWQFEADVVEKSAHKAAMENGRPATGANAGVAGTTGEAREASAAGEAEGSVADGTGSENVNAKAFELHRIVTFIDDDEIKCMRALSRVVGPNPRAIKRFVNSYRIIKCHEGFEYKDSEIIGVLFLLALPIGPYRELLHHFEGYIAEPINEQRTFGDWLASPHGQSEEQEVLAGLRDHLREDLELEDVQYGKLAGMPVRVLMDYNEFVSRFTFKGSR